MKLMLKNTITALSLLILLSSNAADFRLEGKWVRLGEDGNGVAVEFFSDSIEMSRIPKKDETTKTFPVKYIDLESSWGIEVFDDEGSKIAAFMVIPQDKETIKFGQPGRPFFEYSKE